MNRSISIHNLKQKVIQSVLIMVLLSLSSCKFPEVGCLDLCFLTYGEIKIDPAPINVKRHVLVGTGELINPEKYRMVLTTTEYPDNAPPYTNTATVAPLSEDFDFIIPSTDTDRKPLLFIPERNGIFFELIAKTTPAKSLYLYLIKIEGNTYISSGLTHIIVDLNKYSIK